MTGLYFVEKFFQLQSIVPVIDAITLLFNWLMVALPK